MNILIACEDLRLGGAQTFALRLAKYLSANNKVYIYIIYWDYIIPEMVSKLAPGVQVISYKPKGDFFIRKVDSLLYKLGIDYSFRGQIIKRHIHETVKSRQIEVVHSNLFKCDLAFSEALSEDNIPIIITTHGDYELFLNNYRKNIPEYIRNYPDKVIKTLNRVNAYAFLTQKNAEVLEASEIKPFITPNRLLTRKIYNGFMGTFTSNSAYSREALHIPPDELVFGMVARGIPEKGWEFVIDAFKKLNQEMANVHLILVGDNEYLQQLKSNSKGKANIHFVGFAKNAIDWINLFDVGLLPSYYIAESLPNSVIEYLFCGKPAIASNIAEIPFMIEHNGKQAGFIVDVNQSSEAVITQVYVYMKNYAVNPSLLKEHQLLAKAAFKKFDMKICAESYLRLFQDCLKN